MKSLSFVAALIVVLAGSIKVDAIECTGTEGDDEIVASMGCESGVSDIIDGLAGFDTLVYFDDVTDFSLVYENGVITKTIALPSSEFEGGEDTIRNIELLRFGNMTLSTRASDLFEFTTTATPTIAYKGNPLSYATADFNGDGLEDLIFSGPRWPFTLDSPAQRFVILANDGAGGFVDATSEIIVGSPAAVHAREGVVADFNGDGWPDFFSANTGADVFPEGPPETRGPGERNTLLLSTGDGRLVDASDRLPNRNDSSHSVAVGDIDNDGDIDIFVNNIGNDSQQAVPGAYFLINDGKANFTFRNDNIVNICSVPEFNVRCLTTDPFFLSAALADMNGGGSLDLILGEHNLTRSLLILNNGFGVFNERAPITLPDGVFGPTTNTGDVLPIDLNGDGRLDLAMAQNPTVEGDSRGSGFQALINVGNGQFVDESAARFGVKTDTGPWPAFLKTIDFNSDGHIDILVQFDHLQDRTSRDQSIYLDAVVLFLNDGTSHFQPLTNEKFLNVSLTFWPLDKEGDGILDLLFAEQSIQGEEAVVGTNGQELSIFMLSGISPVLPISVSPESPVEFGSVVVGQSIDRSFTVENTSTSPVNGIASTSPPFSIVGTSSYSLAPNTSTIITVRFSPTSIATFAGNVTFIGGLGVTRRMTGTGVPLTSTLTVTKGGSGDGTVTSSPTGINCGSDCTEDYVNGTSVTLTANSSDGSSFKAWSGACTGTDTCTVTMSEDRSVTATYSKTFTDDPLTSKATFVKAIHFLETLEAINFLGQRNGLGSISFTAPIPAAGVPISAKDMITLQTGINAVFDVLGRTRPIFDAIVAGVIIGKRQMDQVRNAIRAVETVPTQ